MLHNDKLILPFSDIRAADLPLVGGKGANLGEMTHAGFPVPPGFCLTTRAFEQFIAASSKAGEIYTLLESVKLDNVESVRDVGSQVRQMLLDVPIPEAITKAVLIAWQALGTEHAYAVRSSATAEDLPDASFAGQQDTYLNVMGEAALLDAIRRCWVSLFTDRAILYRAQNNFPHREVQLSVVVQQMVLADISGIMFTADPLTGHRHTLTIDASFGLGEALVSGTVSPDAYKVDKRNYTILERRIADKRVAIYPEKDSGTRQVTLSEEQRTQTVLTDARILSLADMGSRIEAHYGNPQDIEWAIAGGEIYLLQARPITSLYPLDGLQSLDGKLHVFFSISHQQSMTRAMSPLSLSTVQVLMPVGHKQGRFENSVLRASGGRMYVDLTPVLRHPVLRKVMFGLLGQLDALAPQAAMQVTQHPEFKHNRPLRLNLTFIRFLSKIISRVWVTLWKKDLTGFVEKTNTLMDTYIEDVQRDLTTHAPGKKQLKAVLDTLPDFFPFFLNWVPEAAAGIAATRLLGQLASTYLSPEEREALTLGIPGNVVNEMNWAIGNLVDLACEQPVINNLFEQLGDDSTHWLAEIASRPESVAFMASWEDFLKLYGARGPSEIDIQKPRWYEDPLPILRVIAEHLNNRGCHRALKDALVEEREQTIEQLRNRAGSGLLGPIRLKIINRLYYVMSHVGGMREHHKFMIVRLLAVIKEILKDNAIHLVAAGKLAQADDIWFLHWDELFAIWDESNTDWAARITQRRADLARYEKLTPPLIITSDGESPVVQYQVKDAPEGALLGNPVSPGVAEGIVHVIRDPQQESLAPGEILVTEFTDPGWTPLFINAGGLVLEVGGALTHGAVVAREYGIPAIVGVREATSKLKSGQRVRVNGNRGIIEILLNDGNN